jgi:hypothetical protein
MIRHPNRQSGSGGSPSRALKKRRTKGRSSLHTDHSTIQGAPDAQPLVVARNLLESTIRRLQTALATAVVCDLALKGQNVERDHEIAMVMRWSVVDPLSRQIETLDQMTRTDRNQSVGRGKGRPAGRSKPRALRISHSILEDICHHLGLVVNTAGVCCAALETQNAEADVEIATTLKHSLIGILHQEIKHICAVGRRKDR